MNLAAISSMSKVLKKIEDFPGKNSYEVSNPLSLAGTLVEISMRCIFGTNYKDSDQCIIDFDNNQTKNDSPDKILITVKHIDSNKYTVSISSDSNELISSSVRIAADIINREFKYNANYTDKNEIVINW